jgi:hypothetical protein
MAGLLELLFEVSKTMVLCAVPERNNAVYFVDQNHQLYFYTRHSFLFRRFCTLDKIDAPKPSPGNFSRQNKQGY